MANEIFYTNRELTTLMVITNDHSEAHPDHHNYFLSSPSRVELLVMVIGVMVWRFFKSNELPKT